MSDYTDIQQELDDFENAVYGEEVRDSMVSAIKKIHDVAESAAGAPDATTATAGQAPIADGQGGWAWGDVETGNSVPTNVRQAIFNLLNNNAFANDDTYTADLAVLEAWASVTTAITVSPSTASISGSSTRQLTAVTSPSGGAVTWSSSDTSVATVSSSGLVVGVGNGTCTITATSGSVSATCAVTVSGFATLTGISAVYTQSGTVYDTDTLDSLKADLVVTGTYSDSTTQTITNYTLSGTLAVGTSAITVAYGGKTTTFNVTVSAEPIDTTPVIDKTGKIATYSSYADNPEKATYATMTNGCVTMQYSLDAPSTSLYFAGIFPYADTVLSKANAVASLFALDAEGNHVSHVNEYVNTGRWAQLASGTLVEFKQEWTIGEYSKIMVSLDERYIDDSYLYDYNTGQVIFAGQNTPYYGMSNISEAT